MSAELHNEATECRRIAAEYKQKAEATESPAGKDLYKLFGDSYTELAEAYEAMTAKELLVE